MKTTNTMTMVMCMTLVPLALAACSSGSSDAPSAATTDVPAIALVTGKLSAADPAKAKAIHDQTASSLKAQGQPAGDVSHDALLPKDATASMTAPSDFLGLDQWRNAAAANGFYASATVKADLGQLFAAAPEVTVWTGRDGWTTWGSTALIQSDPHAYVITLRGKFQGSLADAQATHNGLVAAVPAPGPVGQGNTGHMPMANADDPTELLIVEVWNNQANQEHLYADPQFQMALSHFWAAPPVVTRWSNSGWSQW